MGNEVVATIEKLPSVQIKLLLTDVRYHALTGLLESVAERRFTTKFEQETAALLLKSLKGEQSC